MSITIKRNTGWIGSATKIQIRLNGENIAGVNNNQSVDVEIPDGETHLKVTQFGTKSNQVRVWDGDIIRITSTRWLRMSFPLMVIISFLTMFLSTLTYRLTAFFVFGVLIVISTIFFNVLHLNVSDRANNKEDNNAGNSHVGFGISFGLIGGAVFSMIIGLFFEYPLIWAFGPGYGMLIGIVIGAIMDSNENKDS